jgi:hypothetical protein
MTTLPKFSVVQVRVVDVIKTEVPDHDLIKVLIDAIANTVASMTADAIPALLRQAGAEWVAEWKAAREDGEKKVQEIAKWMTSPLPPKSSA